MFDKVLVWIQTSYKQSMTLDLKIKTYCSHCINFHNSFQAHNQSLSQIIKIDIFNWGTIFWEVNFLIKLNNNSLDTCHF